MKSPAPIQIDAREITQIVADLLARRLGYVPEWSPSGKGADIALVQIVARYLHTILQRLNQAPDKNKLAFLDLVGIQLIPAQAACVPVVFQLADNASDARLPAGTRVAAPPPPESNDQIVFETERSTGLAVAKLKEVFSLWPGRDQYIDHSAAFLAGQPFQPFKKNLLQDTPHIIYIAHDTLLALAGKSNVKVTFELTTVSSERLDIFWEFWDGKVWREFLFMRPSCDEVEAMKLDSTAGLTRISGGSYCLQTDCAETSKSMVNGVEAFWVRGLLNEPLVQDPAQVLPEVESIKLSTDVAQPLTFSVSNPVTKPKSVSRPNDLNDLVVKVQSGGGAPLDLNSDHIVVKVVDASDPTSIREGTTKEQGVFLVSSVGDRQRAKTISVTFVDKDSQTVVDQSTRLLMPDSASTYEVTFALTGLNPDKAFADQTALDMTRAFYPFGAQPQPGSTFYFTSEEIFASSGKSVGELRLG